MIVDLIAGDVHAAQEWADEIASSALFETPNYTGLSRPDRFLIGYLGELAVARLLERFGKLHVHRIALNGKSADTELLVRERSSWARLEVKTAGKRSYARLMFPAAQHDKSADYVVATRIDWRTNDGAGVEIMGWLPGERAHALPVSTFGEHGIATRSIEFERLFGVHQLLLRLADVRQVIRASDRVEH